MASQRPRDVQQLLGQLRAHMGRFGYLPADVPIIQPADLFLTRAGDQILHRLFTFERHGVALALRPEFTSPALHRYIHERLSGDAAPPTRWQFAGIIVEDDPASGSLEYERVSSGAECIGLPGPGAEAEVIAMAVSGAAEAGSPVTQLVLSHAQWVRRVLAVRDLDPRTQQFVLNHLPLLHRSSSGVAEVLERFDALLLSPGDETELGAELETRRAFEVVLNATERGQTMGGRSQADIARRLLYKRRRAGQRSEVEAALKDLVALIQIDAPPEEALAALRAYSLQDAGWHAAVENLTSVVNLLAAYDIPAHIIRIRPALVRDWEYYSGLLFELYQGDGRHIAGGGRYDEFARLIGAPVDVPAVGFTYYLDALLPDAHVQQAPPRWILAGSDVDPALIRWAQYLRRLLADAVEILPETSASLRTLSVEADASLRVLDQTFTFDQLDELALYLSELPTS